MVHIWQFDFLMPAAPKWNASVKGGKKKKILCSTHRGKSLWDGIVFLCFSTPTASLGPQLYASFAVVDLAGSS